MRAEAWSLIAGLTACVAALALALVSPRDALTGWVAAAAAFAGLPTGALILMLMMRLIPGAWGEGLRLTTEAASLLAWPAGVAALPVLLGMAWIYPWWHEPAHSGFQALWLSPAFFAVRTILWFASLAWIGARMRRRQRTTATASAGLIVLLVLGSAVGMDWLMSLDPEFASSAFGLQVLVFSTMLAFAAMLLLRLSIGRTPAKLGTFGGLLLTLSLMGAYFEFLPFFIIWSGNLTTAVPWYIARATPGWEAAVAAFALLGGVPLVASLLKPVRESRRWLIALCVPVIAGKLIEFAWFALPGRGPIAVLACCLTMAGLSAVAFALLLAALRARIRARLPKAAR